eukprot:TRINITY_DN67012_c8_g4_i1.p1 TRINITY_DN67012_c8_g4~~TRINITY_DN67012_c8_g4_i1.p1  ORF type:complete len:630 (-),score=24.43 TRINITY_DN67012_c8_g4_i1:126-1820(-)
MYPQRTQPPAGRRFNFDKTTTSEKTIALGVPVNGAPRMTILLPDDVSLLYQDVNYLVSYIFRLEKKCPYWVNLDDPTKIKRVVLLSLPGMCKDLCDQLECPPVPLEIPSFSARLKGNLRQGSAQFFQEILLRRDRERSRPDTPEGLSDDLGEEATLVERAAEHLMTNKQLRLNDYTLPPYDMDESDWPKGWRKTEPRPEHLQNASVTHRIVAIDCEMILTTAGYELARCSVIDFDENVLFDELVKPRNEVKDYLSQYSGITEEMLENVTMRIEECQDILLQKFLFSDTVIVGHSLENDFDAMKLFHTKVADTSVLYPHPVPGRKSALKNLARKWCNFDIQSNKQTPSDVIGHDSFDDAVAALRLFKRKLAHGESFGVGMILANLLAAVGSTTGRPAVAVGTSSHLQLSAMRCNNPDIIPLKANDDDEIERLTCQKLQAASSNPPTSSWSLMSVQFNSLSDTLAAEWMEHKATNQDEETSNTARFLDFVAKSYDKSGISKTVQQETKRLKQRVGAILDVTPPNTLVIVNTGGPYFPENLQEQSIAEEHAEWLREGTTHFVMVGLQ